MQELDRRLAQQFFSASPTSKRHSYPHPIQSEDPLVKLLSIRPVDRTKQNIQNIVKLVRRLKLFQVLLEDRPAKYKDVLNSIAPYIQVVKYPKLSALSVTGCPLSNMLILLEGKVGFWKPLNERSLENSIKMHKHRREHLTQRKRSASFFSTQATKRSMRKSSKREVHDIENQEQAEFLQLTALQETLRQGKLSKDNVWDYIRYKKFANELANPHLFGGFVELGTKISSDPLKWKYPSEYADCIAICFEECIFITLRHEIYKQVNSHLQNLDRRMSIQKLLQFYKNWNYYDVLPYLEDNPLGVYPPKQDLQLQSNELYLICEGEIAVSTYEMDSGNSGQYGLPLLQTQPPKYKQLCTSTQGELIGKQGVPNLKYTCLTKVKILKLKSQCLQQHMDVFEGLREQVERLVESRRGFLRQILDSIRATYKLFQSYEMAPKRRSHDNLDQLVTSRRLSLKKMDVEEALLMADYKKKDTKNGLYLQKEEDDVKKSVIKRSKSIAVCVQNNHLKVLRGSRMEACDGEEASLVEEVEKYVAKKTDRLTPSEITKHNLDLIRAKYNTELEFPAIEPKQFSVPLRMGAHKMYSKGGKVKCKVLGL